MLAIMVFAVLVGPFIYASRINEIDFKAKLKTPSWAHRWARTTWDRTSSRACSTAAGSRWPSAWRDAHRDHRGNGHRCRVGTGGGAVDHALMRVHGSLPGAAVPSAPAPDRLPLPRLAEESVGAGGGHFHHDRGRHRGAALDARGTAGPAQVSSRSARRSSSEAARSLGARPLRQVIRHILLTPSGP